MEDKNGFAYFLLGLGVGVAAGILLAPKAGEETRELLKTKANEGADFLKARANESADYLKTRATDGAEFVRRKKDDIRDSANDIYEKGRTHVSRHKENLSAAVDAGKQAYRDAVTNFDPTPGEGI
jgi:gas vesicle protein